MATTTTGSDPPGSSAGRGSVSEDVPWVDCDHSAENENTVIQILPDGKFDAHYGVFHPVAEAEASV